MKTLRFYGLLLMAVLFASLVACSESSDSEEQDKTVKPDTPVSEGDYKTVTPDGGTLKRGDIAINFPSGTFSSDVKVAVTKAQADKVTFADPLSDFYQITLPKEGTHRTIKLSLKCEDSPQNAVMLLQQQGWDIHTGEKKTIVIPMDTKIVGNTLETEIKELDPNEDNDIHFTVGLAKDMFASTTRADAAPADSLFSVTYDMGKDIREKDWWISFTGKYSSRKNDMIRLVSARLPTTFQKLKDNGYKMIDHKLKYIITAMSNCGEYSNSCLASSWGVVYLSVSDLYQCAENNAISDNVDRTLIHETLHAIYDNMYDKRWAWTKSKTGEKGDEWAMLDEAIGCWSEKLIGGSINSEITREHGPKVMASFFPQKREYLYYRNFGYGLATFIEYLSLKTSNHDIVDLYEYRRKEGTKVYNAYDAVRKFLLEKNINFFSTEGYKDYAISTLCAENGGGMNFWIEPEYCDANKTTSLSTVTDNSLVYNYGVAVKSLQYDTKNQEIKKAFIDDGKLIQVNQNKEGLTTYVYAQKSVKEYVCLGTATKDNPAQIEGMSILNKYYGKIAFVTMKSNQQVVDDDKGISQDLVVEYIEQEENKDDKDDFYLYAKLSINLDCTINTLSIKGDYIKTGYSLAWGSAVSNSTDGLESSKDNKGMHFSRTEKYTIDDTDYENTLSFSVSGLENHSTGGASISNVKSVYKEKSSTKEVVYELGISGGFEFGGYSEFGEVSSYEINGKDIKPGVLNFKETINGKTTREFYKLNPKDDNFIQMAIIYRKY